MKAMGNKSVPYIHHVMKRLPLPFTIDAGIRAKIRDGLFIGMHVINPNRVCYGKTGIAVQPGSGSFGIAYRLSKEVMLAGEISGSLKDAVNNKPG